MPRLNVERIRENEANDVCLVEKLYVYRSVAGPRKDMPSFVTTLQPLCMIFMVIWETCQDYPTKLIMVTFMKNPRCNGAGRVIVILLWKFSSGYGCHRKCCKHMQSTDADYLFLLLPKSESS